MRVNRRTLSAIVSGAILFWLSGFSINLFGNDLSFYDDLRVSAHSNNPHQIPDRFNPRLISAGERQDHSYQVAKSFTGSVQTQHSLVFDNPAIQVIPTLDYTTGTSN